MFYCHLRTWLGHIIFVNVAISVYQSGAGRRTTDVTRNEVQMSTAGLSIIMGKASLMAVTPAISCLSWTAS